MRDLAQSGAKRVEHFVFLNGEHTLCKSSLGNSFCLKGVVVGEVNLDVCFLRFDAGFLLAETCQPRVVIGVGGVESSKEGSGAFAFEVDSANV